MCARSLVPLAHSWTRWRASDQDAFVALSALFRSAGAPARAPPRGGTAANKPYDGAPILSGAIAVSRSYELVSPGDCRGILLILNGYVALSDTACGARVRAPIAMDMELGGAAQNFVGPRRWVMALIDRRFVA